MGSWLGFSFIGINPIPYLMRKQENSNAGINHGSCQSKVNNVKRESIRMNQIINQKSSQQFTILGRKQDMSKQAINELEQSNIELKQSNAELKQSIIHLEQNMNRILHYIEQR